jgi:hypothetical protein
LKRYDQVRIYFTILGSPNIGKTAITVSSLSLFFKGHTTPLAAVPDLFGFYYYESRPSQQ